MKDLDYAVANTDNDDSYLIISALESHGLRHPIKAVKKQGNYISWVNASGEREFIGKEFPIPQELIDLFDDKELWVLEMNQGGKPVSSFSLERNSSIATDTVNLRK